MALSCNKCTLVANIGQVMHSWYQAVRWSDTDIHATELSDGDTDIHTTELSDGAIQTYTLLSCQMVIQTYTLLSCQTERYRHTHY